MDGVAEWVKGLSLSRCSIKRHAISSVTVDIADKTLSCVDLKPLVCADLCCLTLSPVLSHGSRSHHTR
jgi:hypothetical protein